MGGCAGLIARVTSSSRRRRRVEIGAAGRPGRRSDDEQGRPHGSPHARPRDAQPCLGQDRHHVHGGQQRVPRRRQGEGGVPRGRDLGPPGRDRRPLPRQGPAGRDRGPPPDAVMGRREGRPPLEDRDRRLARRDAVRAAQEGLRGAAGGRFARRPGGGARRGCCHGTDRGSGVRSRRVRRRRGDRARRAERRTPKRPPDLRDPSRRRRDPLRAVAALPRAGRRTRRTTRRGSRRRASAARPRASCSRHRSR